MRLHNEHVKDFARHHERNGTREKFSIRYGLIIPKIEHISRDGNTLRVLVNNRKNPKEE